MKTWLRAKPRGMLAWVLITALVAGGLGWVFSMTMAGYWLGQIPIVARNFELAVLSVVVIRTTRPRRCGAGGTGTPSVRGPSRSRGPGSS